MRRQIGWFWVLLSWFLESENRLIMASRYHQGNYNSSIIHKFNGKIFIQIHASEIGSASYHFTSDLRG